MNILILMNTFKKHRKQTVAEHKAKTGHWSERFWTTVYREATGIEKNRNNFNRGEGLKLSVILKRLP